MNDFECRAEVSSSITVDLNISNWNIESFSDIYIIGSLQCVYIKGPITNSRTVQRLMDFLKSMPVKEINWGSNALNWHATRFLSEGLKCSIITRLSLSECRIGSIGARCLADNLKETSIIYLEISLNSLGNEGMKFLADGLKNSTILYLDVECNGIGTAGIKYLADALPDTNITKLLLSSINLLPNPNHLGDEEVIYLSKQLKNTCLTYINMPHNSMTVDGALCLTMALQDTQITEITFGSKSDEVDRVMARNKQTASRLKETFKKLVRQNPETENLEFIIPSQRETLDIEEYLHFIRTVHDTPHVKGHIFQMIMENNCINYPNIVRKINEFLTTSCDQFNTFFNNKFLDIVKVFDLCYINLVKKCEEDMGLHNIVKNLLLHRELYYVDDDKEILHPYIYKMLMKYDMPLFNVNIDPDKKANIIAYYQNHLPVDDIDEIIALLETYSLDDGSS